VSFFPFFHTSCLLSWLFIEGMCVRFVANLFSRHLDTIGLRIRNPQKLHLHPCSVDSGGYAEGREDAAPLGLGYWEAQAEEYVSVSPGDVIIICSIAGDMDTGTGTTFWIFGPLYIISHFSSLIRQISLAFSSQGFSRST
jgi:hypothetical protein